MTELLQRALHLAELLLCSDELVITLAKNSVGIVNHTQLHLLVFGFVLGAASELRFLRFKVDDLFLVFTNARYHVFRSDGGEFRLVIGVLFFGAEIINTLLKLFHLLGKTGTFRFFLHQDRFVTLERASVRLDFLAELSGTLCNLVDRLA